MAITSAQIISDSLADTPTLAPPEQSVQDLEELRSLQLAKRKDFEQHLNQNRLNFGQWIRYARWEIEFCRDHRRARSIFERALAVSVEHVPFWTHYVKFELAHRNYNHARNLLDRAVATLPHTDKLWYLYVQTEEFLRNYDKVRTLFEAWLKWHPSEAPWNDYVSFERRYDEHDHVRGIFRRYVVEFPGARSWLRWIRFETALPKAAQDLQITRSVFELAVDTLVAQRSYEGIADIVHRWAQWELARHEPERALGIFKVALDRQKFALPDAEYASLLTHMSELESSVSGGVDVRFKRKLKYIRAVEQDPHDFDSWWLLVDTLVDEGDDAETRRYLEKAVAAVPTGTTKSLLWRRYVFLWIRFALWEELTNADVEAARAVWSAALKAIPHKHFTFSKIWIMAAEFAIRNDADGLASARKLLGRAIGSVSTPKNKIFKYYVALEEGLGQWDRVRKVYERWLEIGLTKANLNAVQILLEYIDFEKRLHETARAESLYQLGLELVREPQVGPKLASSLLWDSFVDFYTEEFEYEKVRQLYRDAIAADPAAVAPWVGLAGFESSIPSDAQLAAFNAGSSSEFEFELEDEQRHNTRAVFAEAATHFRRRRADRQRVAVLEAWLAYEQVHGDEAALQSVQAKMPAVERQIATVDGVAHETISYVFPDDQAPQLNQFLANAQKWIRGQ